MYIILDMPIDLSPKKKTLVSLPADLMANGRSLAKKSSITFSDYLARLIRADLEARRCQS